MSNPESGRRCRKCGKALGAGDVLCTECGTHQTLGMNVTAVQTAKTAGRFMLGLVACGVVSVACSVVWIVIILFAHIEIGILAWGIGLLCGFTATFVSQERSTRMGLVAAIMAFAGVFLAKGVVAVLLLLSEQDPWSMFSFWDALWAFLAVGSAYRIAGGGGDDE